MPTTFTITLDTIAIGVTPTLATPTHSTPGTSNNESRNAPFVPLPPFLVMSDDDDTMDQLTGQEPLPDTDMDVEQ
jgi:hypothetical protein